MQRNQTKRIRSFILDQVSRNPRDVARITAEHFGITRQAVNRHLSELLKGGVLEAEGQTRNRSYKIKPVAEECFVFKITPDLAEDRVWRECFGPLVSSLQKNVVEICHYGFTEMFNNVLDHSNGKQVTTKIAVTPPWVKMFVTDNGVGIFEKIKNELGFEDERHTVLELTKGKLTTGPEHHTGEGIFFTTRMFDRFSILSGHLFFDHHELDNDWFMEPAEEFKGTRVEMLISAKATRTTTAVFDRYTSGPNDFAFTKTHVAVNLLRYGKESLLSRSQAKRLLARLERFEEVRLDFKGVEMIGQAFADEIFRVFQKQNPRIKLAPVNTNDQVDRMIQRVLKTTEQH